MASSEIVAAAHNLYPSPTVTSNTPARVGGVGVGERVLHLINEIFRGEFSVKLDSQLTRLKSAAGVIDDMSANICLFANNKYEDNDDCDDHLGCGVATR